MRTSALRSRALRRPGVLAITLAGLGGLPALSGGCLGGGELLSTTLIGSTSPEEESEDGDNALLITGAILLGISVVGTVVALTAEDGGDFSYLERHQQEVRIALARGDGPFVADLAQTLALPAPLVPHLGAVVRAARPALEPSVGSGPVDREGARAFARELVRALHDDQTLAPYLDRALTVAVEAHNAARAR
ncbi:MAG: hypothetical protein IT385_16570 [Deltaproteobacteria bacterium]|nr:hypothetical protein [Deltaproteobacteria bacterium]